MRGAPRATILKFGAGPPTASLYGNLRPTSYLRSTPPVPSSATGARVGHQLCDQLLRNFSIYGPASSFPPAIDSRAPEPGVEHVHVVMPMFVQW